MNELVLV